jgi:hypothetical protein
MDGANFVPRKVRRPPTGIDHRQLAPTMMGRGRYQCVDRLLGGETEVEERKPARAEAGIRPMLGQRRTDPGAGKLAAIADAMADVVTMVPSMPVRAQRPASE